jgi:hypothetical protein
MPIRVQVPSHGIIEFPDGTSQDDMRDALTKLPGTSTQSPVASSEPDTYWAGALKGAKEGMAGGAKGFAEGMLQSPASFAQGIASLLTTNPLTTVKDTVDAIKRLPDAVRAAGGDPETWGKGVGDVTGQTMIGLAAPRVLKATAQAAGPVARSVGAAAAVPAGAAIGGYVGGPFGAAGGAALGKMAQEAIRAVPASAAETAATAAQELKTALSSGEAMPAAKFFEKLRQVPPNERPAILAARSAAMAQAPPEAPTAPPAAPPEAPAAPQAPAPTPAPIASPAPTSPAVAAPEAAAVASAPMSTPDAFKAALNAFDTAKVAPQAAEVNNAAMLIKRGIAPDEALKTVLGNRPPAPANPAAELAKRLGTPSEAEMNADMAARARRGQKSLMPKYGGNP